MNTWHIITRWGHRWAVHDGHHNRHDHPLSIHDDQIDAIADAARRNAGIGKPRRKKT